MTHFRPEPDPLEPIRVAGTRLALATFPPDLRQQAHRELLDDIKTATTDERAQHRANYAAALGVNLDRIESALAERAGERR